MKFHTSISFLLVILMLFSCAKNSKPGADNSEKETKDTNADYKTEIIAERQSLDSLFLYSEESPLTPADKENFKALNYFPFDGSYRIKAKFVRSSGTTPFGMPTTTDRLPVYEKFGEAHFMLHNQSIVLNIYQNHDLREKPEYKEYLFLPFADGTNGKSTYDGGRYLDLKIPKGDSIIIDFNKAYNPYCAYNYKYSCPLIPEENILEISIEAGVKDFGLH